MQSLAHILRSLEMACGLLAAAIGRFWRPASQRSV
jgi:hypothetical protein